jgi:hypothetical protein
VVRIGSLAKLDRDVLIRGLGIFVLWRWHLADFSSIDSPGV